MKKIFIGGYGACSVHNEKYIIQAMLESYGFQIVDEYQEADINIITDTCLGLNSVIQNTFLYLKNILETKKESSILVVSGCLAKGLQYELSEEQKQILEEVKVVPLEDIIEYVAMLNNINLSEEDRRNVPLPYTVTDSEIRISPVTGCLNHCSFCKVNYMNFKLQSNPFEQIENLKSQIEVTEYPLHYMSIFSSNLSLYGVDRYGKQRSHDVIKELTKPDMIKFASVGALINWYPELVNEILNNPKIKMIYVSIESGSPRIYELMNRPISLERLIQIIKVIKKERPDIVIVTEFITGFPTETLDDVKKTIELSYELEVFPTFLHPYENSKYIMSSKLQQHSTHYCNEITNYASHELEKLYHKINDRIQNGEMFIVNKSVEEQVYIALLIDSNYKVIRFDQLDREYQIGEMIEANKVKPKQLVKRKR